MTTARERILGRIRTGIRAEERTAEQEVLLKARLSQPKRGIIPDRVAVSQEELIELFRERAEGHGCTYAKVSSESEAVAQISEYLRANNLPAKLVSAPSEKIDQLPWESGPQIERRSGVAQATDETSVTGVIAAVAETGTMVTASGPEAPITLNFVPDNHVVIVRESELVKSYEDSWDQVRARGAMPRAVNWLSGPSRSADIGQTMYMGAHGPRRQHIIFIEGH